MPDERLPFSRRHEKFVPDCSGCYVLTTFNGDIVYIGLAVGLRARVNQHLDSEKKRSETPHGRASWVYWLRYDNIQKLERTWLNAHEISEGRLPVLNTLHSPVSGV
jgi:hypothetical protein